MFRVFTLCVWALILFPVCGFAEGDLYDKILVKINDDIITQFDLDMEMKPILAKVKDRQLSPTEQEQLKKLRQQMLDQMINDKLLAQEILKYGISIPDDVLDDEVEAIKKQRGMSDEDFDAMLKTDGLTIDDFRAKLKSIMEKQELLGYMVHSKVLVTDTEIQKEYEARRDEYVLDKMVELAIIMLPQDVAAKEVKKRIEDGEMTFAEAVVKYSIGPGKDKGGSIGEVEWNDLADEWVASLEGVAEGGVGRPLIVKGSESLLSPVKILEDRLVPLEEVKDAISERLLAAKREEVFDAYFEKLKQSSVIEYMD